MTNNAHFDVISAFLDNEPFAADELTAALEDPAGRAQLVDLIALRHVMNGHDEGTSRVVIAPTPSKRRLWLVPAAAAIVVAALSSGFLLGRRTTPAVAAPAAVPALSPPASAPEPTIVIRLEPGVNWDETRKGQ